MMEIIKDIMKSIGRDKLEHFFLGAVGTLFLNLFLPVWLTIVVVSLIFLIKELYDSGIFTGGIPQGNAEVMDWVFSVAPVLLIL